METGNTARMFHRHLILVIRHSSRCAGGGIRDSISVAQEFIGSPYVDRVPLRVKDISPTYLTVAPRIAFSIIFATTIHIARHGPYATNDSRCPLVTILAIAPGLERHFFQGADICDLVKRKSVGNRGRLCKLYILDLITECVNVVVSSFSPI